MTTAYLSLKQLISRVQKSTLSSRELLECYIERNQHFDKKINAVVATNYDAARERADAADRALAEGERWGPLHGIPMTLKDTWEVVGMPTVAGSTRYKNYYPKHNAVITQRLLAAGAIIYGKTNTPLLAGDLQSFNRVYGTTNNPWNVAHSPGGSSGGSAAALAAGLTPCEVGSDIGGSLRIPAHFCGIYSHKPTFGIIPMRGHIPGPPGMVSETPMAVAGPMARTVDDLSTLLDIMVGPYGTKATTWRTHLPKCDKRALTDFRVLYWIDDKLCPLDNDIHGTYCQLIDGLRAANVSMMEASAELFNLTKFYRVYLNQLGSSYAATLPAIGRAAMFYSASVFARVDNKYKMPFGENAMRGMGQSHADWVRHNELAARFQEHFTRIFSDYDVILMPVSPNTAFKHQHKPDIPFRTIKINGKTRHYTENLMWVSVASLLGLPVTTAPVGSSRKGLPIGIQITGAPGADKTTLQFAKLLSKIQGGFTIPAGYSEQG